MSLPLVRLPSLDLLRGFVAVGRRMSITLAAGDLCLTQSAVSRQIQALEEALGQKLLLRGHRSIAFTPAGERLFRCADVALHQLQEVLGELKGAVARQAVSISATIGIAGLWLMPRLGGFLEAHPEIEVRVSADSRTVDLKGEGIDLAIRYGPAGSMPDGAERLFDEVVVPVAHPSLGLTRLDDPELLCGRVLLEFDGPYRPWLQWSEWLNSFGWPQVAAQRVLRFNQYDQLIHAAVAGQGIALGRRALIREMLADGRLIELSLPRPGPATDYAYWLVPADNEPRPEVRQVMDWIAGQAES